MTNKPNKAQVNLGNEFDAKIWAKEFMRLFNENTQKQNHLWIDESLMIAWFASAIMAGYDHAMNTSPTTANRALDVNKVIQVMNKVDPTQLYIKHAIAICKEFNAGNQAAPDSNSYAMGWWNAMDACREKGIPTAKAQVEVSEVEIKKKIKFLIDSLPRDPLGQEAYLHGTTKSICTYLKSKGIKVI